MQARSSIDPHSECTEERQAAPLPCLGGERRSYAGVSEPFLPHAHEHYVIGSVREGSRLLKINGQEVLISAGDAIAFNPGDVHGCEQASAEAFAYDSVTVAPALLEGMHLRNVARADEEAAEEALTFFGQLDAMEDDETLEGVLAIASLLDDGAGVHGSADEGLAVSVAEHLEAHVADTVSIQALADLAGVSIHALIRAHQKRFSITPLQHLKSMRVERAAGLLAGGMAPAEAAAEAGFADQAHLTRAFKERTGFTPAAYRKMVASKGRRA